MPINNIRNFAIIAHIDHGKSTLADKLLEKTGTIAKREMKDRMMDTLELEQSRGITIKLQTARMEHIYDGEKQEFQSKEPYILNLIDTPGHVDFSYEVSRSLAASETAILLVDATQGIQAQTLTTIYKALEYELQIIPVINKIDLPSSQTDKVKANLMKAFGFSEDEILYTSGKTGEGVEELINRIIETGTPPELVENAATRLLIYDSFYSEHKGVVLLAKVVEGEITDKNTLLAIGSQTKINPVEIGYMRPALEKKTKLATGEVGYIATGLKDIKKVHVGDTLTKTTDYKNGVQQLPGYQHPKPMVFASLYPIESSEFDTFTDALEKLALNDAALTFKRENSSALGSGFLCGFLGLLHLEITQERLEKEFQVDIISTTPTVDYKVWFTTQDYSKLPTLNPNDIEEDGSFFISTSTDFPDPTLIENIQEPWVKLELITPEEYIGKLMELCTDKRGIYKNMNYLSNTGIETTNHVILEFEIPTAEIITNFFDTVKSISRGYASMDYEYITHKDADIVKVSVLINYKDSPELSFLTHKESATSRAKDLVARLLKLIPRQQFKVPIQAAIGSKVIARETIQAYRKDVTAKLYGGDVTRKKKLLEKQKKGKKRLKMFGNVEIPKEAFIGALKSS